MELALVKGTRMKRKISASSLLQKNTHFQHLYTLHFLDGGNNKVGENISWMGVYRTFFIYWGTIMVGTLHKKGGEKHFGGEGRHHTFFIDRGTTRVGTPHNIE